MREGWKEVKLGEVITLEYGKSLQDMGYKASHLNGYCLKDATKIAA